MQRAAQKVPKTRPTTKFSDQKGAFSVKKGHFWCKKCGKNFYFECVGSPLYS